jgi:hypothetical protein
MMNILCYLIWSVDFSTDNDDDKDGDDDDNDDDDVYDVSTICASDYSITNIYLPIYHLPCCSMISLRC